MSTYDLNDLRRAAFTVESRHHFHGETCLCGFTSARARSRTEHITRLLIAELPATSPLERLGQAWIRNGSRRGNWQLASCGRILLSRIGIDVPLTKEEQSMIIDALSGEEPDRSLSSVARADGED